MPKIENVLTDLEKVEFLNSIKGKGEAINDEWTLIHSELCTPDEAELDFNNIVDLIEFKDAKFAIDVVSNANKKSFLDSGRIKIRYKYVLSPEHSGEELIKDNTREFCEAILLRNVVFRREDISMMSFRGVNPIAKSNYSIFKLKGHWNCRHSWLREIYLLPKRAKAVNKGKIINKDIVMSEKKQTVKEKFGKFLTGLGRKLTKEEIVEMTSSMFEDAEVGKFVDIDVDGKILRIDGEVAEKDLAVSWVDSEGNLTDVENSEIATEIDGKKVIIVIEDRKIKEVKEVEVEEVVDQEMKEVAEKLSKEVKALEAGLPKIIAEAIEAKLSENNVAQTKIITGILEAKLKDIPAFNGGKGGNDFKSHEEGSTMLERIAKGVKK